MDQNIKISLKVTDEGIQSLKTNNININKIVNTPSPQYYFVYTTINLNLLEMIKTLAGIEKVFIENNVKYRLCDIKLNEKLSVL